MLGPGNGLRLSEYRDAAQAHDYDKEKCMANVAQNEDFFSTTAFVPTLLKSSLVFCLSPGINRLMTPLECFTVMGMDAHKQGKFLCHLERAREAQRGNTGYTRTRWESERWFAWRGLMVPIKRTCAGVLCMWVSPGFWALDPFVFLSG